jgi:hypothetical protein
VGNPKKGGPPGENMKQPFTFDNCKYPFLPIDDYIRNCSKAKRKVNQYA